MHKKINDLNSKHYGLTKCMSAHILKSPGESVATLVRISVSGFGRTPLSSINNLKANIITLYERLLEGDLDAKQRRWLVLLNKYIVKKKDE